MARMHCAAASSRSGSGAASPFEWDAARYGALPLPHVEWGRGVIHRLHLGGGELVADLGCGTGRDAGALLGAFPGCRVIGVDASRNMLQEAARALRRFGDRITLVKADLTRPEGEPGTLSAPMRVDAVMSVAALHWIPDHPRVFDTVARILRSGGRFVADAGGAGNIARFDAALARVTGESSAPGTAGVGATPSPWTFAGADETARQLRASGFVDVHARLRDAPVRLPEEAFPSYVATVMLGRHLADLDADRGAELVREVVAAVGEPVVDYVRLEFEAVRA